MERGGGGENLDNGCLYNNEKPLLDIHGDLDQIQWCRVKNEDNGTDMFTNSRWLTGKNNFENESLKVKNTLQWKRKKQLRHPLIESLI